MFVKCANCGYLTPESAALCKQCGAVASLPAREPEPAPVAEPVVPPTAAIPTMPPPDPSTAAPGWGAPPPRPPVAPPPVPSMFPTAGARPPRRPLPTWSIVAGAIAIVGITLVALLSVGGGTSRGARADVRSDRSSSTPSTVPDASAPIVANAEFGADWTLVDQQRYATQDLDPTDACDPKLATEPRAQIGDEEQYSFQLQPSGTEHGHLSVAITRYPTAADAQAVYRNRDDVALWPCIERDDADYLRPSGDTSTTNVVSEPLERGIINGAITYHHQIAYDYEGIHSGREFWSAYYVAGRYKFSLHFSGTFDPQAPFDIIDKAIGVVNGLAHAA